LGFFSLNKDDLERKAELGDDQARKVFKIRKRGNLLLCTLLIGNVAVNSTLSIFLGSIASGFVAGIVATVLIVIFGEIIPQAAFSRYALITGAKLAWLVRIFIVIFFLICWPLAWALDKILGDEMPTVYSKHELIKIIEDHEDLKESEVDRDEERIIKGALSFSNKIAQDIMTPRTEIFSLSIDQKLDQATIKKIFKSGHSRIPVYEEKFDNIIGLLYVKDLILSGNRKQNLSKIVHEKVIFIENTKPLDSLFNAFKKTKNHLFVVMDEHDVVSGLVTIEDVLEEIIGDEIVDEYDQHEDLRKVARDKIRKKKRKTIQ
jgi:metal transporter CNNM